MNRLLKQRAAVAAILLGLLLPLNPAWAADDPVAYSFAFFGCNRLDKDGVDATGSKSTANVAQLTQSFKDIANLTPLPSQLFMAGDVVKAKKPGTKVLAKQLTAWVDLVTDTKQNPLLDKKVRMVAFTGNHEMLVNKEDSDACKYAQCPNPPAYPYWQKYMSKNQAGYNFIAGKNGPTKGGPDKLIDDESKLSYSFRSKDVLFVVLNTDSQIDAYTIGDVPLAWIKKQLQSAQKDADIHHVFVMGHKPIYNGAYDMSDPGDRTIRPAQAADFYALLNDPMGNGSPTKVRAYLAAHSHEWGYMSNLPLGSKPGTVPQIIAGNGGSPPNSNWQNPGDYFGYTVVQIAKSGKVTAQSYGRDIDQKEYYNQKVAPTTSRGSPYTLYTPPGK